jgi:hypothetical protein
MRKRLMCLCGKEPVHKRMFLCDECLKLERRGDSGAIQRKHTLIQQIAAETGREWSSEEGRLIPPGRRGCLKPGQLAHMTPQQQVEQQVDAAMRELSKTPEPPRRIKAVFATETLTPDEIDALYGQLALTKETARQTAARTNREK